jgi:predicted site-specific integrase-resolvase
MHLQGGAMARSKNTTPIFSQDRPIRRVALYARVSTLNGQQDPEMQFSELREYATRRGLSIHDEYVDQGVSGSKESRPALDDIVRKVRFPDWQHTSQGERLVQKELRRTLLKYKLHTDQELFDKAYEYIRQYY